MENTPTTIVVRHSANQGLVAGALGCALAVLGIFSWGLIFVPLAAACAVIALIRGIAGRSAAGIGCSVLAGILTFWGFVASPSLWLLVGAGLIAAHSPSYPVNVSTSSTAAPLSPGAVSIPGVPAGVVPRQGQPISTGAIDALKKQANAQANAAMTQCRSRRLVGEIKTYVGSVECSNPRIIAAYWNIDYRYMDLISDWTKKRLEVAQKEDAGQLTEAQAESQLNQFLVQLTDRERQRDLAPVPCSPGCDPNSVGHRE